MRRTGRRAPDADSRARTPWGSEGTPTRFPRAALPLLRSDRGELHLKQDRIDPRTGIPINLVQPLCDITITVVPKEQLDRLHIELTPGHPGPASGRFGGLEHVVWNRDRCLHRFSSSSPVRAGFPPEYNHGYTLGQLSGRTDSLEATERGFAEMNRALKARVEAGGEVAPTARSSPRLPGTSERPFPTELFGDLGVREDVAVGCLGPSPLDRLNNVEVIEDVFQAAVVGKAIEKLSDGLLGL